MRRYVDGQQLHKLRVEVGLTQEQIARQLGITRETVISIEKNHPGTIDKLPFSTVEAWGRICRHQLQPDIWAEWQSYLKKLLGFPQ